MTNPIQESKGVPPSEYAQWAEKVLTEHAARVKHLRRLRRATLLRQAAFIIVCLLAAAIAWRACH